MIDVSNLKDTLKTLGFVAYGDIYEKVFSEIGCSLKVDFQAKRLIYPNEIKGRERNDGFDQKENFVVFECVCRLLSKGYRPEHIELEKEWHLGHDAKGGRADICVSDTDLLTKWRADPFCGKIVIGGMQHDGTPKQTNGNAFRRYRVTDSRNPPAAEDRADGIL